MEGCLLGLPSIAFSQAYMHDHPEGTATHHSAAVARRVLTADWPRKVLININFPDVVAASVKGVRSPSGNARLRRPYHRNRDPRGGTYLDRLSAASARSTRGSDIAAIRSGHLGDAAPSRPDARRLRHWTGVLRRPQFEARSEAD